MKHILHSKCESVNVVIPTASLFCSVNVQSVDKKNEKFKTHDHASTLEMYILYLKKKESKKNLIIIKQ